MVIMCEEGMQFPSKEGAYNTQYVQNSVQPRPIGWQVRELQMEPERYRL